MLPGDLPGENVCLVMHHFAFSPFRLFALLLSLFTLHSPLYNQIKPSRGLLVEPLDKRTAPGLMSSTWFAGSFQRGWGSYEEEQAWQFRLHGIVEPYRFGSDSNASVTTSLQFHHELTSSTLNDLGFNPRTARWEEQLNVHIATSPLTIQAGVFHRCKHDIDNSEPPNDDTSVVYEPIKRTLILTGFAASASTHPLTTFIGTMRISGGGEYYFTSEDYRTPESSTTGTWRDIKGALWFRGEDRVVVSQNVHVIGSYYISFPFFASRNGAADDVLVPHEARAELVAAFLGSQGAIEAVFSADHTFDEVAFIVPQPTTVFQVGVRFRSL